jgi:hypothetical protein
MDLIYMLRFINGDYLRFPSSLHTVFNVCTEDLFQVKMKTFLALASLLAALSPRYLIGSFNG